MLMEALVPHETTCMVRPVWHSGKQRCVRLFDNHAVLKNHTITMHVGHRPEHVAQSVFARSELCVGPRISISGLLLLLAIHLSFLQGGLGGFLCLHGIDNLVLELGIKAGLTSSERGISGRDVHLFIGEGRIAVPEVDVNGEGQLVEALHEDEVARVAGLRSVERARVEERRRGRVHLVLALLEVVLFGIVLVVLIHCVRQEVVRGVLDLVSLPICVARRFVGLRLIVGQEILAKRVV